MRVYELRAAKLSANNHKKTAQQKQRHSSGKAGSFITRVIMNPTRARKNAVSALPRHKNWLLGPGVLPGTWYRSCKGTNTVDFTDEGPLVVHYCTGSVLSRALRALPTTCRDFVGWFLRMIPVTLVTDTWLYHSRALLGP